MRTVYLGISVLPVSVVFVEFRPASASLFGFNSDSISLTDRFFFSFSVMFRFLSSHRGRVITKKGQTELDTIANQVSKKGGLVSVWAL
jgi:hypothetical protein